MSYPTDLNDLAQRAHKIAREHGFWDVQLNDVPTKLMLIVTEVAEAMEQYRTGLPVTSFAILSDGKPDGFVYELADIIIRVLDLSERYDLNIQQAVWDKMHYNEQRPHMHGKIV